MLRGKGELIDSGYYFGGNVNGLGGGNRYGYEGATTIG